MKALILAAGAGSRLAPLTNDIPKTLVPVCGQPILLKQIDNLHENAVTDITIVAGYRADLLRQAVHAYYPDIRIIENAVYASTNNMYSAWLARNAIGDSSEFCMMNADVYFDASVITALQFFPYGNAVVTDIGNYLDESMKVTEKGGRITHISKNIMPKAALGCSIDIYRFSAEGARAFFAKCGEYICRGECGLWSEVALDGILGEVEFRACPAEGRWVEIDNMEDLRLAERIFRTNIDPINHK